MRDQSRGETTALSRRIMLQRSVMCTAGAAAFLMPAVPANAAKMQKNIAGYQDTPKGDQRCDNCSLFQPPNACQIVDGEIGPSAWCKFWVKKAS